MSEEWIERYAKESTLIVCRGMLADNEQQLAWLKSHENTEDTNPDFEYTEQDIAFYEREIRELKAEIAKLEAWFNEHPAPPLDSEVQP